jgi:hypothetical protein
MTAQVFFAAPTAHFETVVKGEVVIFTDAALNGAVIIP